MTFEQWQVPTLGQRSRDPVEGPDGRIWWVGQWGNLVGVLDPETGAMREYPLPDGTYPHSVTLDSAGIPWLLGNKNGTLQRLDPESGEITVFPMPDPAAKDPHTGEFDQKGRLIFTLQQSNRVGRFDPATGAIDLIELDRPKSRPYGIKFDAAGQAWVACNGGPCLYRIDPNTLSQTRIDLPNQESHVRRLDVADDGSVWYVNSGAGRLGQYTPATGRFREWPSPSGPKSHPTAWSSSTASFGTTSPACAPIPSCALTQGRKASKAGPYRRLGSTRGFSATPARIGPGAYLFTRARRITYSA